MDKDLLRLVIIAIGGTVILGLILSIFIVNFYKTKLFSSDYETFELIDVNINFNIYLLTIAITLIFAFLSGVIPAIQMAKLHPANILKGGVK